MKNNITVFFDKREYHTESVEVSVNNQLLYEGKIKNIEEIFNIEEQNTLKIKFKNIGSNSIEIKKVLFNYLSIEHFIFEATFEDTTGKTYSPYTHIKQNGIWTYTFGEDLAKKIIGANT